MWIWSESFKGQWRIIAAMEMEISRKTPIGELVLNHPVAAAVLLEHGFHCIGCGLAAYETIEEGAAAHGFDDAQIDALVLEIQDAAKNETEFLLKLAAKSEDAAKKPADAAKAHVTAAAKDEKSKKAEKKGKKSKPG